jgi:hypothetical protein
MTCADGPRLSTTTLTSSSDHVRAAEVRAGRWADIVSNLNQPRMTAMRAELEGTVATRATM